MKTKEQIVKALESGNMLSVGIVWNFSGKSMSCGYENCCSETYNSFEEAADAVIFYSNKKDLSDVDLD